MAIKYLAGDRLIGTTAERTALTTTVTGSPTANASLSVGIDSIDEDDDYGYIHDFEEWFSANTSA